MQMERRTRLWFHIQKRLRRLPLGDRRAAKGLCRPVGTAIQSNQKAVGGGGVMIRGSGVEPLPLVVLF